MVAQVTSLSRLPWRFQFHLNSCHFQLDWWFQLFYWNGEIRLCSAVCGIQLHVLPFFTNKCCPAPHFCTVLTVPPLRGFGLASAWKVSLLQPGPQLFSLLWGLVVTQMSKHCPRCQWNYDPNPFLKSRCASGQFTCSCAFKDKLAFNFYALWMINPSAVITKLSFMPSGYIKHKQDGACSIPVCQPILGVHFSPCPLSKLGSAVGRKQGGQQ